MTTVYDANHPKRSDAVTAGPDRAAARSYLRAAGLGDAEFKKPMIGVVNTWSNVTPCNMHLDALAGPVREGVLAAGGVPIDFNTIMVTDGISMGTPGMRYSLVSREVIADSIELAVQGHTLDGVVVIVGCDKTIPAAAMALARMNLPGLVFYGGTIMPGLHNGREISIQQVFEAIGAHGAGTIDDAELKAVESAACPGAGACGGPVHRQHHGHGAERHGPVAHGGQRRAGRAPRQGGRGRALRSPRCGAGAGGHSRAHLCHARKPDERGRGRLRQRRLDQCGAAPDGRRGRSRSRLPARRLPHRLPRHTSDLRPAARRDLRGLRPLQGGRHGAPGQAPGRGGSHRRHPDRQRPDAVRGGGRRRRSSRASR